MNQASPIEYQKHRFSCSSDKIVISELENSLNFVPSYEHFSYLQGCYQKKKKVHYMWVHTLGCGVLIEQGFPSAIKIGGHCDPPSPKVGVISLTLGVKINEFV